MGESLINLTAKGKTMNQHTEGLYKARDCAGFVVSDLQDALKDSDSVLALHLLPMIERAAFLNRDITALINAINAKG